MSTLSLKVLSQPSLTSAGTAQSIAPGSTIIARSVMIYAAKNNTGAVYIGNSDATAKVGTGINLSPGEGYPISGDSKNGTEDGILLSSIYFDGATTGNKLVVHYLDHV